MIIIISVVSVSRNLASNQPQVSDISTFIYL